MDAQAFRALVLRLEDFSARAPAAYKFRVAMLALLGFGLLVLVLGVAGAGLAVLAGLALASLIYGGKFVLLLIKLGKLLLVLALPLWYLLKNSLKALLARLPAPQGRPVTPQEAPALFAALERMRHELKGPAFHQVLLVDEINAAVVQRPLWGLFGPARNYLLLGLPLLEALDEAEALAVVAHEYGHLASAHSRFGAYIYRLRNSWSTLQAVARQWTGPAGRGLQRLVDRYVPYFNAYSFVLARADEYEADAAAAALVGASPVASALKRVRVLSARHEQFIAQACDTVRDQATPPEDLAVRWAAQAVQQDSVECVREQLARALQQEPDLGDTHPTLQARLGALGVAAEAMAAPPQPWLGPSAAEHWLGSLAPVLRQEFQLRWREAVAERWTTQFEEWAQRRSRFEALSRLDSLNRDQRLEHLRLALQLFPDRDHLPALAAFNSLHPDHAEGLYLQGVHCLDRDDAAGLDLLEQAMRLDRGAIRPACERAHAYLQAHQDKRAKDYADRWQQQAQWEGQRNQQLETLSPSESVQAAELSEAQWEQVRSALRGVRHLNKAWIARRVIAADPDAISHVLVFQPDWATRLSRRQRVVMQQLMAVPWATHLFLCNGGSPYKALAKQVRGLAGSQIHGA